MKLLYKSLNMQRKLTMLFCVCTLIPVVMIFIFAIASMYDDELAKYNTSTEKKLNGAVNVMNRYIDEDIIKSETIIRSSIIIDGLQENYKNDIAAVMMYYRELSVFMAGFGIYGEEKCCIYPVEENLPISQYIGEIEKLKESEELWEKLNASSNSELVWDYTHTIDDSPHKYISFFKKINDYEKLLGFFETRIYVDELIYPLQNMTIVEGESVSCISFDGVSFYSNEVETEKEYDIEYSASLNDGSVVLCTINNSYILKNCYKYIICYVFGFAVLIAVLVFLYRSMVSAVTKDLNDFIGELQKDTELTSDVLVECDSVDSDIALIKRKFCDLLQKTRKMYSDIVEINRAKRAMELELLQSGINPHLLYNSLSVIRWQMLRLHQTELVEMIDNMTDYYRQVLAGGDYIITIREELELVERYIRINELSYKNEYKIIKNIDEDVLSCPTIKLILQPIVENAILHGLVEKENGIINITITKNADDIIFVIEDNGYGMTEESIKKVIDTEKVQKRKGGYGISNTIKRIKMYYGDECGIDITSEVGKGTVVVVRIKTVGHEELKKRFDKGGYYGEK